MRKILRKILELLYPSTCIFCGKLCGEGICKACREKVKYIREPRCKKCGKPIESREAEFCYDCRKQTFHYEQGRSLWLHQEPISNSIYAFKYKNRQVDGEVYGREMARRFEKLIRFWEIDVIIPVPIHKKKRRKRGFNQAELIAKEVGNILNIPVNCTSVVRMKETTPQKELGSRSRKRNLKRAFRVTDCRLKGKRVLLIDDIYTTGSTIDSIAEILGKTGCEKIYFLTISIGQGF